MFCLLELKRNEVKSAVTKFQVYWNIFEGDTADLVAGGPAALENS